MLILENTACTFASHRKQNLRINTTELVLSAEYNGRTAQCNTKATGLRVSTFPRVELDLLIFLFFGCFSQLEKFSFLCLNLTLYNNVKARFHKKCDCLKSYICHHIKGGPATNSKNS